MEFVSACSKHFKLVPKLCFIQRFVVYCFLEDCLFLVRMEHNFTIISYISVIFRVVHSEIWWHILLLLIFKFPFSTHLVRLTFIMVINNFQSKIGISFNKRCSYVWNVCTPFPTMDAVHNIINFVIFKPTELFEPIRSESSRFSWRCGRSSLERCRWSRVSRIDLAIMESRLT